VITAAKKRQVSTTVHTDHGRAFMRTTRALVRLSRLRDIRIHKSKACRCALLSTSSDRQADVAAAGKDGLGGV
jgi:hypothetical protein